MTVKHTTETWVERAREVHENDPDLSYVCSHIEGEKWRLVFCMKPGHGLFKASKQNHTKNKKPTSCPVCAKESKIKAFSLGHEEYCRRLHELNSALVPLDQYINSNTRIPHKCMICFEIYDYRPDDVLRGHYRCYYDSKSNSHGNDFVGFKEKSIALYEDTVDFSRFNQRNFDFDTAGTMICKTCDHTWKRTPHQHLRPPKNFNGIACPKCSKVEAGKRRRKPWDQCESEFKELQRKGFHRDLELREETKKAYEESGSVASQSIVPVWCNVCKDFYDTKMTKLLAQKTGCGKHRFKTELFVAGSLKTELPKISGKYEVTHHNLKEYKGIGAMDISIEYDNSTIAFVEVDGEQHFTNDTFLSKKGRCVQDTQNSDEEKHLKAEQLGMKVIRIFQPYVYGNDEAINSIIDSIEKIRNGEKTMIEDLFIDGGADIYQAHTLYHYELQKLS